MNISNRDATIWNNARDCNCDDQDCEQNHKLCGLCTRTIIWGAHESNQPNSRYAWNVDHKIPLSRGGGNHISNLQAVHVSCNQNKGSW